MTAHRAGTAMRRAVLGALVLLVFVASTARGAEPTLGGLVTSPKVGTDSSITIENRSTVRAVVDLATTDSAYVIAPVQLVLEPGQRSAVDILATGTEPASIVATFTPADPPPGITGAAVLEAAFRHPTLLERVGGLAGVLFTFLFVVAVIIVGARRVYLRGHV